MTPPLFARRPPVVGDSAVTLWASRQPVSQSASPPVTGYLCRNTERAAFNVTFIWRSCFPPLYASIGLVKNGILISHGIGVKTRTWRGPGARACGCIDGVVVFGAQGRLFPPSLESRVSTPELESGHHQGNAAANGFEDFRSGLALAVGTIYEK